MADIDRLNSLGERIAADLKGRVTSFAVALDELTLTAEARTIVEVLTYLRDDPECRFVCFIDICGVDYPEREKRFDVVYHLLSPYKNQRIRVKVEAGEQDAVPSVIDVFPAADWYERETYDLYGVLFQVSRPAAHSYRLWLFGSSFAQGFSPHRPCRGSLRR